MADNITRVLEEYETRVKNGDIISFWISVRSQSLFIKDVQNVMEQMVPLEYDMFNSLHTFFYGVEKIEYKSHDYTNLKSFVNARMMLDRLLNREDS